LESRGAELTDCGFLGEQVEPFVRDVCRWGGYPGIAERVLRRAGGDTLRKAFSEALECLAAGASCADGSAQAAALRRVNLLPGLGSVSFATKHLRFLRPCWCPVLDSLVRCGFGYSDDPEGYAQWSRDCLHVARLLAQAQIARPGDNPPRSWNAADVEAALFAALQGW